MVEGNRSYIPCIYVLNKIDQISIEELDIICKIPHTVPISAHHKWNYDDLLDKMWTYLKLVRIYTKPKVNSQLNQLEKLEAAKAAGLVCLSLLSLTGPYLALLSLTGPYWALLGLTGPYCALLGLT